MRSERVPYSYRADPRVPKFPDDHPIIIFDGVCVLCSGSATFVLRRDAQQRFRLLTAQSALGHALYVHYGLDPDDYESMILIADGIAYFKSEAGIRIAESLGPPWSLAAAFRILPRRLRDRLYGAIARNRYRLFGKRQRCYLASEADRGRFLAY
ncbi:MAG: thiol-disulfide oxidoreductase DCC family protein [Xanthobacteraceae bacterium]